MKKIPKGHKKAITLKITGHIFGRNGYEKGLENAIILIDSLVGKGNEEAIRLKIEGLSNGWHGYKKNPQAAIAFNDHLAKQGNKEAIKRKIEGVLRGRYGYTRKKTIRLKTWIEAEAYQGERWACYLKAQGLKYGILGFQQDHQAAILYIQSNNIPY